MGQTLLPRVDKTGKENAGLKIRDQTAVVTTTIRLRFDARSTSVRLFIKGLQVHCDVTR